MRTFCVNLIFVFPPHVRLFLWKCAPVHWPGTYCITRRYFYISELLIIIGSFVLIGRMQNKNIDRHQVRTRFHQLTVPNDAERKYTHDAL